MPFTKREEILNRVDINKDGKIDVEELYILLREINY